MRQPIPDAHFATPIKAATTDAYWYFDAASTVMC
jgi:hypothetical protein